MAPSTTGNSGARGPMTSEGSGESSWMEGGAGDNASWNDLVTRAEAGPGASKRKKTNAGQPAPHRPFPLASEGARKEVMGLIHIFIYYFIINFNDILTLILYMMDELMKLKNKRN